MSFQLLLIVMAAVACSRASIIPINHVGTTYTIPTVPVVTAHSHQVVARNFNRVYVPTVATVGYPGYSATAWNTYPYTYRHVGYPYGYGGYPYGYTYPYATSAW